MESTFVITYVFSHRQRINYSLKVTCILNTTPFEMTYDQKSVPYHVYYRYHPHKTHRNFRVHKIKKIWKKLPNFLKCSSSIIAKLKTNYFTDSMDTYKKMFEKASILLSVKTRREKSESVRYRIP